MQEKWEPHKWQARSFSPSLPHVRLVILVGSLSYAAAVADGVLSLINLLMFPVAESLDHSFISFLCLSLLPPFCLFLVLHLPRLHISSRSWYTCFSKVLVKKLCYASKPLRAQQVKTMLTLPTYQSYANMYCSCLLMLLTRQTFQALLTRQANTSNISKRRSHVKHFRALLTLQTSRKFANTSNMSSQC